MIQNPSFSYAYGFAAWLLGVCSFLWHASNLKPHDHWDIQSMHSVVIFPIFYLLFQLLHWIPKSGDILLVIHFGLKYYMFLFGLPVNSKTAMLYILVTLVGLSVVTFLILYSKRNAQVLWFFGGIVGFVVGYGLWNLEKIPRWCFPDSLIQFHGLWHVFTALAMLSLFWYFRTEVQRENVESDETSLQTISQSEGIDLLIEQIENISQIFDYDEEEN